MTDVLPSGLHCQSTFPDIPTPGLYRFWRCSQPLLSLSPAPHPRSVSSCSQSTFLLHLVAFWGTVMEVDPRLAQGTAMEVGPRLAQGTAMEVGPRLAQGTAMEVGPRLAQGTAMEVGPRLAQGTAMEVGPRLAQGTAMVVPPQGTMDTPMVHITEEAEERRHKTGETDWHGA
ncbi:hypothetical protein CB1_000277012 [Camelus ferus]|nr:hypothetical protein CB1_000277012 [Camelus ferus]